MSNPTRFSFRRLLFRSAQLIFPRRFSFPPHPLKVKTKSMMEGVDGSSSEVENDAEMKLLRDRFRLSAISITESRAKQKDMEVSKVVVTCIADLAFKYTERVAKDLHLFAQHANRKSVNVEDVILCTHRNEHLSGLLRTFSNDLKAKDPQSERKRKRETKRNDKGTA